MKIAVLGPNGMLGHGVTACFNNFIKIETVEIDRSMFDVLKHDISKLLPMIKECDAVINCIGVIKPMIDKYTVEEVLKINCTFPKNLAKLCALHCIPCFHITTDCAYTGTKGQYDEMSYLDATDLYGLSKIAGETSECMTIRTSIVGEEKGEGRSLLSHVMRQRGKAMNGFENHFWNGVTTTHLAFLISCILKYAKYKCGVFHVFTKNSVSKRELLDIFNQVYDLGIKITPVDASTSCDRTLTTIRLLNNSLVPYDLLKQITQMKEIFDVQR